MYSVRGSQFWCSQGCIQVGVGPRLQRNDRQSEHVNEGRWRRSQRTKARLAGAQKSQFEKRSESGWQKVCVICHDTVVFCPWLGFLFFFFVCTLSENLCMVAAAPASLSSRCRFKGVRSPEVAPVFICSSRSEPRGNANFGSDKTARYVNRVSVQ